MPERKAVFCLRHYNDIDHIVPVIHKLLARGNTSASIIITSDPSKIGDYRLRFLQNKFDIPIRWIGEYSRFPDNHLHRLAQLAEARGQFDPIRLAVRVWDRKISTISPLNQKTAARLLSEEIGSASHAITVFDWINSEKHLNPVLPLIEAAHSQGIPVVSLPHGDSPYFNRLFYLRHLDYSFWSKFDHQSFDHVVVPNELTAQRYRSFRSQGSLHILGSPRYNREWLETILPIIARYENPRAKDRRRLVLFLRNPTFPVFWEEVSRTLSLITQFEHLYLVVKHHTRHSIRGMKKQVPARKEPWASRKNIEFVSDEVHSSALIQWADLVLDLGTSVVSEAVMINKPVLALEHLHANISTLAHYIPQLATNCRDDLYLVLDRINQGDPLFEYYPEPERRRYIQEMIEYPSPQVLERYSTLLESLLK